MRLTAALFAAGFAAASCFVVLPAFADEFSPAQKQELGTFIRDYLVNNPGRSARSDRGARQARQGDGRSRAAEDGGEPSGAAFQLQIPGDDWQSEGERHPGRIFRLQLPVLQRGVAGHHQADEGRPKPQAGAEGFPRAPARLGRSGEGRKRSPQPVARRQVLGLPHEAPGDPRAVGKAEALAVAKVFGLDMDKLSKDMESPRSRPGSTR